jgi:hypothetical protein
MPSVTRAQWKCQVEEDEKTKRLSRPALKTVPVSPPRPAPKSKTQVVEFVDNMLPPFFRQFDKCFHYPNSQPDRCAYVNENVDAYTSYIWHAPMYRIEHVNYNGHTIIDYV